MSATKALDALFTVLEILAVAKAAAEKATAIIEAARAENRDVSDAELADLVSVRNAALAKFAE